MRTEQSVEIVVVKVRLSTWTETQAKLKLSPSRRTKLPTEDEELLVVVRPELQSEP